MSKWVTDGTRPPPPDAQIFAELKNGQNRLGYFGEDEDGDLWLDTVGGRSIGWEYIVRYILVSDIKEAGL